MVAPIDQLNSGIAKLLQLYASISLHQKLRWDSVAVRKFATLTRDTFESLGDEYRGRFTNPFFVFDIGAARYGTVLDGPAIFRAEPTIKPEQLQVHFEERCSKLADTCLSVLKDLRERRHALLRAVAHNADNTEQLLLALEELLGQLVDEPDGATKSEESFGEWDKKLQSILVSHNMRLSSVSVGGSGSLRGAAGRRDLLATLLSTAATRTSSSPDSTSSVKHSTAPSASSYILILTVSAVEFNAVCAHLQNLSRQPLYGPGSKRLNFRVKVGVFDGHMVVVVCSLGGGDHKISAAMAPALLQFNPSLAMFVGVGGGVAKTTTLGGVVVGDYVADYSKTKEELDGQTSHFVKGGPVNPSIVALAHEVQEDAQWMKRIMKPQIESKEELSHQLSIGKVVSSNTMITSDKGRTSQLIAIAGPDTLAVDMESGACYCLASEYEIPFVPIRGISDIRTDKSDETDKYRQPWAAAHASAVAFELIYRYITEHTDQRALQGASTTQGLTAGSSSTGAEAKQPCQAYAPAHGSIMNNKRSESKQEGEQAKAPNLDEAPLPVSNETASANEHGDTPEQFWKEIASLTRFGELPKLYRGSTVRLHVRFEGSAQTVSEHECDALALEYGASLKQRISIVKPELGSRFKSLFTFDFLSSAYATYDTAEWLLKVDQSATYDVTLRLEFGDVLVRKNTLHPLVKQTFALAGMQDADEPGEKRAYFAGMIIVSGSRLPPD